VIPCREAVLSTDTTREAEDIQVEDCRAIIVDREGATGRVVTPAG
jgi:hypothetical protein